MSIIKLPIVQLARIGPTSPFLTPVQTVTGGLTAMVFSVPGKPYKLVGFSAGLFSGAGVSGAGLSTWTDGIVRVPIQILVPPTFDPIARGVLELFYVQENSPPTIALSGPITAYAELRGVIYPGVSQVVAAFNLPNTATFTLGAASQAALIVEDFQERDQWHV
jgi:hypothetical protein